MVRAFATSSALLMILVPFTVLPAGTRAESSGAVSSGVPPGGTTYGPGIAITPITSNRTRVEYLPTFQRWDGMWRPVSALNRSVGEWPYLVNETSGAIAVSRLGKTFTQSKIPGASFEFLPGTVKETVALPLVPPDPVLTVPFSSAYGVSIQGNSISLRDTSGSVAWTTDRFHAWDSAVPPVTWERPVTSIALTNGTLRLYLNTTVLARASFPLYVDPTWTTNATLGWPSITKTNTTEDYGDHALRIGWFADNFNDGTKDSAWLTDTGSWSISAGAAQLGLSTRIRTSASQWDTKAQASVTITASGGGSQVAKMLFRWSSTSNYYFVEINQPGGVVSLKKTVSGTTSTLCSKATTVATNTPYTVKVDASGGSYTVLWNGALLCSATDTPPTPWSPASVGFETSGTKIQIALDDVRAWTTDSGSVLTNTRTATPCQVRTVHAGTAYRWVDLRILSSSDNLVWGDPHYVKAGAKSKTADIDAYQVQDADRKAYYRAQIDLRTTEDYSPSLTEIAVIEGACTSVTGSLLGYEPWRYYIGGIVEALDGNLVLQSTDLSLPGKGWPVTFTRTYNSRNVSSGPLGSRGWTHSYNAFLTTGIAPGTLDFYDGDGTRHTFEDMGNSVYSSPLGLSAVKLVKNGDGTYTMTWKDGTKRTFSSAGKLTQMVDRNGNKVTLTYDGTGKLTKVADDTGVFLMLSYDGSGRINRVGDHNATISQRSPTIYGGSWSNGQNALTSDNLYASTKTASATETYSGYGFSGPSSAWITKVEACVEAYTAGDDALGVKISTNAEASWSAEQIVNLPAADPNALTCLDFTSYLSSWTWSALSDTSFRVQVRYVQVGSKADFDYLDWIPVKVSTASRYVSYAYDGSGRLSAVTDALGNSSLFFYDSSQRMSKYVDRADKTLEFVYNFISGVSEVWTGKYNRTTASTVWKFRQYLIDTTSQTLRTTVTDASGNVTTIDLESTSSSPTRIDGPLAASAVGCSYCGGGSQVWTFQWDGEHDWFSKTDGRGSMTGVTHDYRGNVLRQTDALGNYTEGAWQNRDNGTVFDSLLLQQRNKRAFVTTNMYDWKGNLVKRTDALGNFTQTVYDASGFVTKATDKRGFNTTFTYDAHRWLTQVKNPLGFVTTYGYDSLGRQVNVTTSLGFATQFVFDALDRRTKVTDPMGDATSYVYNARGDLTKVIDPNMYTTQFQINVTLGSKSKTIEAGGNSTSFGYDTRGNLITVTNLRLFTTTYQYDAYSRQINETTPGGNYTRFTYDPSGNVATRIDANGNLTTYVHDKLNRMTKATYPGSVVVTYQYDSNGNAVQVAGFGYIRNETWDALDRAISTVDNYGSFSKTFGYWYDADSHRTRLTYSDSSYATYFYNAAGWQTYENHSDGQSWSFAYDNDGRRTTEMYPNGVVTTTKYDKASRMTNIWTNKSGSVLESFAYTFDNSGNRKLMTEANGSWANYRYDNLYRLLNESYSNGRSIGYTYDADGNRLTSREIKVGGSLIVTTNTFGKDDQLLKAAITSGATTTYTYDKNGDVKTSVTGSATTTYAYDIENRLTSVTTSSSTTTYAYSPDGRRLKRVSGGTTTYFGNDPVSPSRLDDTIEEYTSTGTKTTTYLHGTSVDELLGFKTTVWYDYHGDALGSVTRLTDSTGTTSSTYRYDAFGTIRTQSGSTNLYGFTSRENQAGSSLYNLRARYYDAGPGRFLQADPAGTRCGPNLYSYVGDNPVNWKDSSGRCGWWDFWCQARCNACGALLYFAIAFGLQGIFYLAYGADLCMELGGLVVALITAWVPGLLAIDWLLLIVIAGLCFAAIGYLIAISPIPSVICNAAGMC